MNLRRALTLIAPAFVIVFFLRLLKHESPSLRLERHLSLTAPPETTEGLLQRHESEVYEKLTDANPLPGVQMVYMYVNGSDPNVSAARARFGGTVSGTINRSALCFPVVC